MTSDQRNGPQQSRPEHGGDGPAVENLPTPGAVRLGPEWAPTLDGEPITCPQERRTFLLRSSRAESLLFPSREEAWREAIKWVKHRAGLAIRIKFGSMAGCTIVGKQIVVDTIEEARSAILDYVVGHARHAVNDPVRRKQLHLDDPSRDFTWEDLLKFETGRHYDPTEPWAQMSCSYRLYRSGPLSGVGGAPWIYNVIVSARSDPAVWNHPADEPAGLDPDDDAEDEPPPMKLVTERSRTDAFNENLPKKEEL